MQKTLSQRARKIQVIIVDKNTEIIEALSLFFKDRYDIHGFSSVEEAQTACKVQPDIIVMDIFPLAKKQDVSALIRSAQTLYRKIPILFVSTSKYILEKVSNIGSAEFLEKPFDAKSLQEKIYTMVG